MVYSRIKATGMALPEKVMTNADIAKVVDTSDEWIRTRTGIAERRVSAPDEATSDLGVRAAQQALDQAGMDANELDAVILATITGDMPYPATACLIQDRLGAQRAMAFDLSAACTGYLYGLSVADAYIRSGLYRNVMVIGAETMTKFNNWDDRTSCILFGDAAGATLLTPSEEPGVRYFHLGSRGDAWDLIHIPAGGSRCPTTAETLAAGGQFTHLSGKDVYRLAVKYGQEACLKAVQDNQIEFSDIDLLVPHQANERITEALRERLGLPREKVVSNIEKYGNTSGATIPVCLHEAAQDGRLKRGDTVLMVAFGAGFTWGSALMTW